MIKLRLFLIGTLALAASVQASLTRTIQVTTAVDEDGTGSACSLREAVRSVNTRAPYGGCPAGSAFDDNVIQLQTDDYILTRELTIAAEVEIVGNDSDAKAREDQIDPLTGKAPRRMRPDYVDPGSGQRIGTSITAASGSRIFYATAPLALSNLELIGNGAVAGNGGIIYSGSVLSLGNTIVRNGWVSGNTLAQGNGGGVYLAGGGSSLNAVDSTFQDNQAANKGGAIAMSCSVDLTPYALHTVDITRSLFKANSSTQGAGAIELCGNTNAALTASTLARNNTSNPDAGAITYVQGKPVFLGQLVLSYVTAAEQVGHVLAVNGLASASLTGSLLGRFADTAGATTVCHNPDTTVAMISGSGSGTYNAVADDGSCNALLSLPVTDNTNVAIPLGTNRSDELVGLSSAQPPYQPEGPFGLTEYYLPRTTSAYVTDRGADLKDCNSTDQRNLARQSGAACDIGAVERLQVTANDDTAESKFETDRLAIVDVLANDTFGEDDVTGPLKFRGNLDDATVAVVVTDDAGGSCVWKKNDDAEEDQAGMLVVDNGGVLADADAPITCTYHAIDSSGAASADATVTVQIRNAPPRAVADYYVRPVGVESITFNPLKNDDDDGDGPTYGKGRILDASGNVIGYTDQPGFAPYYPIEIIEQPALGEVQGTTGICPGGASTTKICLNPPLRYVAKNNLSPFADTFTYRVYDQDGDYSNAVTVTVATNAPDPDHGGGAGSLDWLAGLVLSLFGLRRLRSL